MASSKPVASNELLLPSASSKSESLVARQACFITLLSILPPGITMEDRFPVRFQVLLHEVG